jgi:LuxR family transcriptional regulator, maltose regulon positive regulatory protein
MVDPRVTGEFIQPKNISAGQGGILVTRLNPPSQQTRLLPRPRIDALLNQAAEYPLTLLVAPAGSGKTTALAGFVLHSAYPVIWCRMTADDDPSSLVRHIIAAFGRAGLLEAHERLYAKIIHLSTIQEVLDVLVNELTNKVTQDTLLILDDYHQADQQPALRAIIERLIAIQPKLLHIILSTRYRPELSTLPTAYARGEMYPLEQHHLAFTVDETEALFQLYDYIFPASIHDLTMLTRGWPLTLQLLATHKPLCTPEDTEDEGESDDLRSAVEPLEQPGGDKLFVCLNALWPVLNDYLTQQVYHQQPAPLQDFLLRTALLRGIDEQVCAALPGLHHVQHEREEVERRNLFIESVKGGHFQYQPLFHIFLDRMAHQQLSDWRTIHEQAVAHFQTQGDMDGVIYHLMEIHEDEQAATLMQHTAGIWIKRGRGMALLHWLDRLPEAYQHWPTLLEARAAAYRQVGRFEQALQVYSEAETAFAAEGNREGQSRTLRGRAEVYLDTVQPAPAEALLEQALTMLPEERRIERAEILLLQAENWANRGRADIAFQLETAARKLAQEEQLSQSEATEDTEATVCHLTPMPSLSPRLLLRSGRLNESRRLLETELGMHPHHQPSPRSTILAHREPLLLLALLNAMLGNGARALAMALRGLIEAQQRGSPLTEGIAHMRVGHAYQVISPLDAEAARRHYQEALTIVESFGVTRTKVEGLMGLALLHGQSGDLVQAETIAQEGLHIAEASGDEWIAAMIWLALGGAAVADTDERACVWLDEARRRFISGDDSYGQAVVALWLALWHLRAGPPETMQAHVATLLELARSHSYEGLLTAPTLSGPRDMAMLIPVLLCGRTMPDHAPFVQKLLRQAFPTIAADETVEEYHPGYTLRIQMLGSFRVWRGTHEIQAREWQREKARQLLQLLLTYRGQWLQREQICSWLWPDNDLDAAERQFKVTLNALNTALEPFRPPRTTPFFVRRQGLAYSFAPSYGCWIDVDEFELRTTNIPQSDPDFILRNAQVAVNLYEGDYLAESLYDSWTLEERERLLARYLATATALGERLMEKGDLEQSVSMCERVLRRDRCYEEAYQVLMRAYALSGSRSQALRSYTRCVQALSDDLGIEPLPETTQLYEAIKRNEQV